MKYKFILKKIQYASIEDEFDSQTTLYDAMNKIAQLSEEELGFSQPEYHLEAVTKENGKISKIIWKSKIS